VFPCFKPHRYEDGYSNIVVLHSTQTGLMVLRHDIGMESLFAASSTESERHRHYYVGFIFLALFIAVVIVGIAYLLWKDQFRNESEAGRPSGAQHVSATSSITVDQAGATDGGVQMGTAT